MTVSNDEQCLPPSAREFENRLKEKLSSIKSRQGRLATCESTIHGSVATIEEGQLQWEITRNIVSQDKLYKETHTSLKQWEESLRIEKGQLDSSKNQMINMKRYANQVYQRTGAWPWSIMIREQHPKNWSRAILEGLAKLARLCKDADDIRTRLQDAIQLRVKRTSRTRGLSKVEKLVSADIYTVIEAIERNVPSSVVDVSGIAKKRKKNEKPDKTPARKRAKTKSSAGGGAGEGGTAIRGEAAEGEGSGEGGLGKEDAGGGAVGEARNSGNPATASAMTSGHGTGSESGSQEISSTQRNAGLRPDVEAEEAHARTDTDQRATVQDVASDGREPVDGDYPEPAPQQSLLEPPCTPQAQTKTVTGLLTPVQSELRTALQCSSKLFTDNTPTDPLDRAETASALSESRFQDAKEQYHHIKLDRDEIEKRIYHCEKLRHPAPILSNPEIERVLFDVAEKIDRPYNMLEAGKEKANTMLHQAYQECEYRRSIANMWVLVKARLRPQPRQEDNETATVQDVVVSDD